MLRNSVPLCENKFVFIRGFFATRSAVVAAVGV